MKTLINTILIALLSNIAIGQSTSFNYFTAYSSHSYCLNGYTGPLAIGLYTTNEGGQLAKQFNNFTDYSTFFSLSTNTPPVAFALINYSQKIALSPQQFNFISQAFNIDEQSITLKCASTYNNKFTAQLLGANDASQMQVLQTIGIGTDVQQTISVLPTVYANYQIQIIENANQKIWYTAPLLHNKSLGAVLPTIVHNQFSINCIQPNITYSIISSIGNIVQKGSCAIGNNVIDFAAKQMGNYKVVLQSADTKQVTTISKQ